MTIVQRQITKKERASMMREAQWYARTSAFEAVAFTIVPAAFLATIGSVIWLVIARMSGLLPRGVEWSEVPVIYWGVVIISLLAAACSAGSMLFSVFGNRKVSQSRRAQIAADLKGGMVEEERVNIIGVKIFREPEHHGKIYFLLLDDNRVLVRYDYESANMEGGDKSKRSNFPLNQQMTMVRFPQSGLTKYSFSGQVIRKPRAVPVNIHPSKWPEDETYCTIPWDDLVSVLSA